MDDSSGATCSKEYWIRVLGIVSSIVGLIGFTFAIVTYVHNRQLIAAREKQEKLFMAATARFTKTLDEKNAELGGLSDKLNHVDQLYAKVDAIHDRLLNTNSPPSLGTAFAPYNNEERHTAYLTALWP